MAVTSGTVHSVSIVKAPGAVDSLGWALVLFTMSGTYAQADNSILSGVPTLIQNSTRNGKTVALKGVSIGQTATKASDNTVMGLKTAAISTNDVTFELTTSDLSTEHADATAIASQNRPFGLLVAYTES